MSTIPGSAFPALTLQSCLRNIDSALRAGNSAAAMQLAADGAARGFAHPQLLTLAAHERLSAGDVETALRYALAARELAGHDPDVLTAHGRALAASGRTREAVAAFDAALRQTPGSAMLRFNKADALEAVNEMARARREYERALALEPVYPEALARLANIAALGGDGTAAREYANRALKQNPRELSAALALATADLEDRRFEAVLSRASAIARDPSARPVNRSIAQGLVGDALDGLGRQEEAFAAYRASNATRRAWFQSVFEAPGMEGAPARAARLAAYFRTSPPQTWRADLAAKRSKPSAKSALRTHVFLVGFPRSGTTLLEQVLAGHGDVDTMEERDSLNAAFEAFVMADGGLDRLAGLSGAALEPWRKAYWKMVGDSGLAPTHGVFVDKMPLNTVLLPLIAKLFPNAKILFALRDPRDVVLSCFRRRFGISAQMYEFLTLEGAARYYDAVMGLADIYRGLLGLDLHTLRYEDLVADFDGEARGVCDFLGLEWDAGMRDFAQKTRTRAINTPSAVQVARGLYTQGAGQWRAYAAQMQPVLPLLAPWCAKFGYEEN